MKTITIDIANASHEALGSVLNVALTHGLSFTFTTDGPLGGAANAARGRSAALRGEQSAAPDAKLGGPLK